MKKKVGAVVYARDGSDTYFALIHDVFGHWTLSKGGLEEGESDDAGLKRIIKEEMGIDVIGVKETLGETEYVANHPEKGKHRKQVTYYLVESKFDDIKLGENKGGLDDAKWFKAKDIVDLNFYKDIVPLMTKSVNFVMKEVTEAK